MPSEKSWILSSMLSLNWSIPSKVFYTDSVCSWLYSPESDFSPNTKYVRDCSTVEFILVTSMARTYSASSSCSAMNAQIPYNSAGVVMNGTLDDLLVVVTVILNWLLLLKSIMQFLWYTIAWQTYLAFMLIGWPRSMRCSDSNILPASSNKMVYRMTTTVSIPLSSTKGRSQSPCWVHLILFPSKLTTCAFPGRKLFIVDGPIHMLQYNIVSIPTSNDLMPKDTLILCSSCASNANF